MFNSTLVNKCICIVICVFFLVQSHIHIQTGGEISKVVVKRVILHTSSRYNHSNKAKGSIQHKIFIFTLRPIEKRHLSKLVCCFRRAFLALLLVSFMVHFSAFGCSFLRCFKVKLNVECTHTFYF